MSYVTSVSQLSKRRPCLRFTTPLLAALVVSGCGAGTDSTSPPPGASHPAATTATPSAPLATPAEKEAEHEPAAEKARRQKMVQEVIAGCAACRDRSSGPSKSPAKEHEAAEKAEKANERRGAEAAKQVQQIQEYKAAKRAAEEQAQP